MLRRKENLTVVTAIPPFIPQQLALDILHSYSEVITLNPLVIEHRPVPAPRTAAADEFYSSWYEIVERIRYAPGISGRVVFRGCFQDLPTARRPEMLRRKENLTVVTAIPPFIPRQLALDILHSHSEVITLNPLVIEHRPVPAPRTAAADEFYSSWYEIVERIRYAPGISGRVVFRGCFQDLPWGLQTHVSAPLGVDIRSVYRVAGNQPGLEPPEPRREPRLEALGAPSDGLYLREDVEIRCNVALAGFVRAQLTAASREMVRRIIRKAELLDAGVLRALMTDDGRLKTINPNDRSSRAGDAAAAGPYWHVYALRAQQALPQHQEPPPAELPGLDWPPPLRLPARAAPSSHDSTASEPPWSQSQLTSPSSRTSVSSVGSPQASPGTPRKPFAAELAAHDEAAEAP